MQKLGVAATQKKYGMEHYRRMNEAFQKTLNKLTKVQRTIRGKFIRAGIKFNHVPPEEWEEMWELHQKAKELNKEAKPIGWDCEECAEAKNNGFTLCSNHAGVVDSMIDEAKLNNS